MTTMHILFGHKLHQKLTKILNDRGFKLEKYVEKPFEVLIYNRNNSQSDLPDVISFHGLEKWYPNSIFASAWTHLGEGYNLKTLKELLPEYPHLSTEDDRWVFDSEVDLDKQLDEITRIVETRLLPWFDNPVNNPSGLDMSPKQELTKEQLKAKLLEGLRLSEIALEKAAQEGHIQEIERHKRSIEEYRLMLENQIPD